MVAAEEPKPAVEPEALVTTTGSVPVAFKPSTPADELITVVGL